MKKNNVAIDFVSFGELDDDTTHKLSAFNDNVKGGDGSHLAVIPPGPGLLSDQLITSPILNGDGSSGGAGMGGAGDTGGEGASFEFGIDPSIDPELALALRMSMEDEKARVERENKQKADQDGKTGLEGIKEEDEAKEPLLNKDGEASGTGSAEQDNQKNDAPKKDDDKMDMA